MTRLRGILLSAGYFAQFHAQAWRRMDDVAIVAVVDPQVEKARQFAERHGISNAYATAEEAIDRLRPDFVDIATRPESHLALTQIAADRQAHVICQKPMAPTREDCEAMCVACEKADVRLLIHENWRWQPWYREAHKRIARGDIGRPFQFSFRWRTGDGRGPAPYPTQPYCRQMPRFLVYETLVHLIDTLRFLGGPCQVTSCSLSRLNPLIAGEDQALIQLRFASDAHGWIDANRVSGPPIAPVAMAELIVEGDLGSLRVAADGHLFWQRHGDPEERTSFRPTSVGYKGDSVFATQRHLIDSLRSGAPSESDGRSYLANVDLVDACYRLAGELPAGGIPPEPKR